MKKYILYIGVAAIVAVLVSFNADHHRQNSYCMQGGKKCLLIYGPWTEATLLTDKNTLTLVRNPLIGDKNVLEIRAAEGAILEALENNESSDGAVQKPWGSINNINIQSKSVAKLNAAFFFENKKYLAKQKLLLHCTDSICLDDIKGFSGFE